MTEEIVIDDLRCVTCGREPLVSESNKTDSFRCLDCDSIYESIWGVPFFGQYESDDLLGLIEISANITNRGKFGINPEVVENWEMLLAAYHQADDKQDFIKRTPQAQEPYFANRYGEWSEISHLTKDLDLNDFKVLDIGAGLGFDGHRLSMRGAKVTALEFSPILAESGQLNFPDIRWIGGFSHCLPFINASFDAVFCNAGLHHMRDIPVTISESLRVLRTGGILITTCDSFRPSYADDDFELRIFDQDPAVLLGVNESIPRFSDFVSTLQQHPELVDVEVYTHTLHNFPFGKTLTEFTPWDLTKDWKMLSKRSGSLALRVKLKAPWPDPAGLQVDGVLSAKDYALSLDSESTAMTRLAPLMPEQYVDLPFPGGHGSKFELLNGWRLKQPFHYARTAYRRGRWFLRRPVNVDILIFDIKLPSLSSRSSATITVALNGEKTHSYQIGSSYWTQAAVDLTEILFAQVFAIEIKMQGGEDTLEAASFIVRNRGFQVADVYKSLSKSTNSEPMVYAVIPVFNRILFTLECIKFLNAQTYPNIQIIVVDGGSTDGTVDKIRNQYQNIVVLNTDIEMWWAGSMAMGINHVLRENHDADGFVLMMNNDTQIPENYVASLVLTSQTYDAAVGSIVVDSQNPLKILDAGEYIDWNTYSFPVTTVIDPDELFRDDVDVLPGRGSLVPLEMIRSSGNIDAQSFPHYSADEITRLMDSL